MRFLLHWNKLGASMLSAVSAGSSSSHWCNSLFSLSLSMSVPLSLSFFALFVLFICFPLSPYLQGLCQKEWEVLKRIAWPSQLLYPCSSWGMSFNRKQKKKTSDVLSFGLFWGGFLLLFWFWNSSTAELLAVVFCSKISISLALVSTVGWELSGASHGAHRCVQQASHLVQQWPAAVVSINRY